MLYWLISGFAVQMVPDDVHCPLSLPFILCSNTIKIVGTPEGGFLKEGSLREEYDFIFLKGLEGDV